MTTSKVQFYIPSILKKTAETFQNRTVPVHTTHILVTSPCAAQPWGELSQRYRRPFTESVLTCLMLNEQTRARLNFNSVTLCRVKQSLIITCSQDFQAPPTYRKRVYVSENGDDISKSAQKKSLWTWNFKVFKTDSQLLWKCILGFINILGKDKIRIKSTKNHCVEDPQQSTVKKTTSL